MTLMCSLQAFFSNVESASQWQEEAQSKPWWPPIYIQWASRGPLVAMSSSAQKRLASYSHPEALGWKPTLCFWRRQSGGTRLAVEARTSEAESQEALRTARGARSRHRGGKTLEALQRPTLQPTHVRPSG